MAQVEYYTEMCDGGHAFPWMGRLICAFAGALKLLTGGGFGRGRCLCNFHFLNWLDDGAELHHRRCAKAYV